MPISSRVQPNLCYDLKATIPAGQTVSDAQQVYGTTLLAFITPSNLSATSFTFLVSDALNGTFVPLKDMSTGSALTSVAGTSAQYATQPSDFASVGFLKIVSNTTQLTSDAVITLVTRAVS